MSKPPIDFTRAAWGQMMRLAIGASHRPASPETEGMRPELATMVERNRRAFPQAVSDRADGYLLSATIRLVEAFAFSPADRRVILAEPMRTLATWCAALLEPPGAPAEGAAEVQPELASPADRWANRADLR